MLQQTQVATVIPYYERWLRRFPDFAALAAASENDVLLAWQGLGYYARAQNLHFAGKAVENRHHGEFPHRIDQMRKLPGVGQYTAHAIASFAFNQSVPVVEANTARVLARLFNSHAPIDSSCGRETLWKYAASLVPARSARIYNSALMDLGALVCLPSRPKCHLCPVKKFCCAKNPELLPRRRPRPAVTLLREDHAFVLQNEKVLLEQASRRWRGMWILPMLKLDGVKPSSLTNRPVHVSAFSFTHHRVTLRVFRSQRRAVENASERWFALDLLDSIPIPSPHRRAIVDVVSVKRATAKRRPQS